MPMSLDLLAQELNLSPSGLRKRITALGLEPERGSRGRVVLTPELEATLREADRLMGDGAGAATVRRVLRLSGASQGTDAPADTAAMPGAVTLAPLSCDAQEIRDTVARAIADQTDLAERYARAAHRVGELEATVRAVEADRDRLAEQAIQTQADLAQAREQAREQAQTIATLTDALGATLRPWWKLWG
jgi:AraC-like DNA-binding protein